MKRNIEHFLYAGSKIQRLETKRHHGNLPTVFQRRHTIQEYRRNWEKARDRAVLALPERIRTLHRRDVKVLDVKDTSVNSIQDRQGNIPERGRNAHSTSLSPSQDPKVSGEGQRIVPEHPVSMHSFKT